MVNADRRLSYPRPPSVFPAATYSGSRSRQLLLAQDVDVDPFHGQNRLVHRAMLGNAMDGRLPVGALAVG